MARRLRVGDFARMLVAWAVSSISLIVAAILVPGFDASSPGQLILVAAVSGVFGFLIRPVLIRITALIGWLAVAAVAIAGQAVIMHLALLVVPGVSTASFWTLVAVTWVAAFIGTTIGWLGSAGTDEAFTAFVARHVGKPGKIADPETDGVVFVQLDGVSFPIAQWALQSGTMPHLRGWLDGGTHGLQEWRVQTPCTTPASQLGILHGTCAGIPGFRWYDRQEGRVLVANKPADAALIESRASTGRGLLADDGVSISNLFSGDAALALMVMSRVNVRRASPETRYTAARFVSTPAGFARSLARTGAEIGRERFQARQQRRRRVVPRVHRPWAFTLLRAAVNGLVHDISAALVGREMMRGARSIYVDFVDYDEVAHHAGGNRIEALRVLQSLDQTVAALESVAELAPRRYHFVVLSDHGQSQGAPFEDRYGVSLGDLCAELTSETVLSVEKNVESWGRVEVLLDDLAGRSGRVEQTMGRTAARGRERASRDEKPLESGDVVVLGSGNLGLLYVQTPRRLTLEEVETRWPRLLPGLAAHPGIGFVATISGDHGPVVLGPDGYHRLRDGHVEGTDPLQHFGPDAPLTLARAVEMPEAPDVYVNSLIDTSTSEIAAFEDLVGAHGGLGGWQDRGTLLLPRELVAEAPRIVGADELHSLFIDILEGLGHRRHLPAGQQAAMLTEEGV